MNNYSSFYTFDPATVAAGPGVAHSAAVRCCDWLPAGVIHRTAGTAGHHRVVGPLGPGNSPEEEEGKMFLAGGSVILLSGDITIQLDNKHTPPNQQPRMNSTDGFTGLPFFWLHGSWCHLYKKTRKVKNVHFDWKANLCCSRIFLWTVLISTLAALLAAFFVKLSKRPSRTKVGGTKEETVAEVSDEDDCPVVVDTEEIAARASDAETDESGVHSTAAPSAKPVRSEKTEIEVSSLLLILAGLFLGQGTMIIWFFAPDLTKTQSYNILLISPNVADTVTPRLSQIAPGVPGVPGVLGVPGVFRWPRDCGLLAGGAGPLPAGLQDRLAGLGLYREPGPGAPAAHTLSNQARQVTRATSVMGSSSPISQELQLMRCWHAADQTGRQLAGKPGRPLRICFDKFLAKRRPGLAEPEQPSRARPRPGLRNRRNSDKENIENVPNLRKYSCSF